MADVLLEADTYLQALADRDPSPLPAGTAWGTQHPDGAISAPYVQTAWDGTPSWADNREGVALRVTVWAPRKRPSDAQELAGVLLPLFVSDWTAAALQRVTRGPGRLPGVDPETGLPFCTFTVYPQLTALTAP